MPKPLDPFLPPGVDPAPASQAAPVPAGAEGDAVPMVEVTRGGWVESQHRGWAVVADTAGHVIAHWGDPDHRIFPRSAAKSMIALQLVESGAADAYGLDDRHLALACASHAGEPMHSAVVTEWLARIACVPDDLECGVHPPRHTATAEALVRERRAPSPIHHNCSGKHTGMLATARHLGETTAGYAERTHPVQQRILGTLEQVMAQDLGSAPIARDGCSVPIPAVPIGALAMGLARMADPSGLPATRAQAARRIVAAWAAHPELIAGTGEFDTEIMLATGGAVLCKGGAEGVATACLPGAGLGIAVKAADGAARGARFALAAILDRLGALEGADRRRLEPWLNPVVTTIRGLPAGDLRRAPGFPDDGFPH